VLHRRCLALDPADPRTYVILGKTLLQQRRYDEARVLYQDGCANTGLEVPAQSALHRGSLWPEAVDFATSPITTMPCVIQRDALPCASCCLGNTNPYIWSAWGWLEAVSGNADRARQLYDAALVVDSTHVAAWQKWGMLEQAAGNYARARDLWLQVGQDASACG
jgi:hypothetical protein